MDFIFNWLMGKLVWCCYQLGWYTMGGIKRALGYGATLNPHMPPSDPVEGKEAERLAGCKEVVLSYATHLGYIARECMSRIEIEQKIDAGITPQELAHEIYTRIDACSGIFIGHQTFQQHPIKLPYFMRDRHAYIIGKTGSGKTNFIRNALMQDIDNGCGVGVLAPEQELITEEILPYIPEGRIDDVVYMNPADTEYPIPFNPLHLDTDQDIDQSIDDLMTIFTRLSRDISPRMREIMYHTFYALMERQGSTLLDVELLLDRTETRLRNEIIHTTQNPRTARFFRTVFPALSKDACVPIYTRIGQLISPKRVRTLLCQPGRSFNFRQAMDDGRILLFNLSDGILGEQTSRLLGQLIISKIQMAVMSRADTPKAARTPFYLYLDEFAAFVGVNEASYATLLSRARKYHMGLMLAHQQTGQIPHHLLQEILGNVSTMVCFSVANHDARRLCHEFVIDMGVDAPHVPPAELLRLKVGQAWAKIDQTVFPLQTPLADPHPDPLRAKEVIERSRKNYGFPIIDDSDGGDNGGEAPPDDDLDPAKVF